MQKIMEISKILSDVHKSVTTCVNGILVNKLQNNALDAAIKDKNQQNSRLHTYFPNAENFVLYIVTEENELTNQINSELALYSHENVEWVGNNVVKLPIGNSADDKLRLQQILNIYVKIWLQIAENFNEYSGWKHKLSIPNNQNTMKVVSTKFVGGIPNPLHSRTTFIGIKNTEKEEFTFISGYIRTKKIENITTIENLKPLIKSYLNTTQCGLFAQFTAQCQRVTLILEKMEQQNSNAYLNRAPPPAPKP